MHSNKQQAKEDQSRYKLKVNKLENLAGNSCKIIAQKHNHFCFKFQKFIYCIYSRYQILQIMWLVMENIILLQQNKMEQFSILVKQEKKILLKGILFQKKGKQG